MAPSSESQKNRYRLEFENRPDYLYILIKTDRMELEASKEMMREIAAEMKKAQQPKILTVMDVDEPLSTGDNFWLISEFPGLDLYQYKVAVVNPKPEYQEVYNFADMVACNRGFTVRSFTTIEEAEEWLL